MPSTKTPTLKAPFPYYGGKSRDAAKVWKRFGDVTTYAEPFAGSLAVMLASDPHKFEVVSDTDGHICNLWRAIALAPDEVAWWADYPTSHRDLTARQRWLILWARENADNLSDPGWFDAKAAGWWIWGKSSKPGRFCVDKGHIPAENGKPFSGKPGSGQGAQIQRASIPDAALFTGGRLVPWMMALAERLKRVYISNQSWELILSDSFLRRNSTGHGSIAVFLDPPYTTDDRDNRLYSSDISGTSADAAGASWAWAVEHGGVIRVAYCCHEGDIELPAGWTTTTRDFSGFSKRTNRDMIAFSPACLSVNDDA